MDFLFYHEAQEGKRENGEKEDGKEVRGNILTPT